MWEEIIVEKVNDVCPSSGTKGYCAITELIMNKESDARGNQTCQRAHLSS